MRCHCWHWGGTEGHEHGDSTACTQPVPQGCGQQPRAWLAPLSSVPLNPVTPCRNAFPAPQAPLGSQNLPRAHPHAPIPCLHCKSHPDREASMAHLATDLAKRDKAHLQQLPLDQLLMLSGECWRKEITGPAAARKDLAWAVLAPGRVPAACSQPWKPQH